MGWWLAAAIGIAIMFLASMPVVTVNAQSFYVTTSKSVYEEGERVVVAGTVSEIGNMRPVVVMIKSGEEECAKQNVRPLRDGSFISRPMTINKCGPGQFEVTATHAGMTVYASFLIEDKRKATDNFELRVIRSTVISAQDTVNARMKEILDANLAIPERAAEAYRRGMAEASLTLQAVDRGKVETAIEHRQLVLSYFRETLDILSPENLNAVTEDVREQDARVSAVREWFGRLQDLLGRLVDLAEKNRLAAGEEFVQIDSLLNEARRLIGESNIDSAEDLLRTADGLLEQARKKLIEQAESDDPHARSLISTAERLENWARELRREAAGVPEAIRMVNASFVHINGSKSSIEEGDFDSARRSLESALRMLEDAQHIITSTR